MTLVEGKYQIPAWDEQQRTVIFDAPSSWQLVIAGPGAGKSAVACQRVAHLVDQGVPPPRILLVSFTRTAVAELRDRIVSYAVAGELARGVRISTVDSHAWSLRSGFDDQLALIDGSYDMNIERTVEIFREGQPDLVDFMSRLEHLIVDEAQDVLGARADLILEMLKHLSPDCGVTILADPAQAIYGFTRDGRGQAHAETGLLGRLPSESPRPLTHRTLDRIHRIRDARLVEVFQKARQEVQTATVSDGHIARVQQTIRETSKNDAGVTSYDGLPELLSRTGDQSTLVLFRWRADVLVASSYLSQAGIEHRLRLADGPTVVKPWLGWLFGEYTKSAITKPEFADLWQQRREVVSAPFDGEDPDACWTLLHRFVAGSRAGTVDVAHLRRLVARPRPPVEICSLELGYSGPILGTIHASKGREADTVVLVIPGAHEHEDEESRASEERLYEEGRVYYVGATRARKMLVTTGTSAPRVGYLDSGRVFRFSGRNRAQLEVGRRGDVDSLAHLAWANGVEVQRILASCVGTSRLAKAVAVKEHGYARRIFLERNGNDTATVAPEVGQLGDGIDQDLKALWGRIDRERKLRPAQTIPHLHVAAVTTVGVPEDLRDGFPSPFNQSGIGLAAVAKGFPMISFVARQKKRSRR